MPPTLASSWMLLMLALGLGGVIAAYLACRDASAEGSSAQEHLEEHAQGLQVGHGRVPRVLIALYLSMGLGMVGYVLYIWLAAPAV